MKADIEGIRKRWDFSRSKTAIKSEITEDVQTLLTHIDALEAENKRRERDHEAMEKLRDKGGQLTWKKGAWSYANKEWFTGGHDDPADAILGESHE